MTTVVDFPERRVLADEAADWLIRLDADTPPTAQELEMLGEWLHRSPAHREELESLANLWGRMNVLTELAVPLGKPTQAASQSRTKGSAKYTPTKWQRVGLFTASVAIAVILGIALLIPESTEDSFRAANGLYATAVGQQKTTTLPDGSRVLLNTNSQIRVDYSDEYRRVHLLQGEALFTVAKDATRPFRVYAASGRIQAIGTAFSVYVTGADVQVTVTEGRVSLASVEPKLTHVRQPQTDASFSGRVAARGEAPVDEWARPLGTVNAGQVATLRGPEGAASLLEEVSMTTVTSISPRELAKRLAWSGGSLMFSGDSLEQVIKEVSRYTTVSIEITDPALRQMRIGGRLPVSETEVMLAALESNFNVQVTRLSPNRVILTAANE